MVNKKFWLRILLMSLVLGMTIAGCSLVNSPKAAVRKFGKAIERNDMKALAKVATPETVELVATFGPKIQGYASSMSSKKIKTVTEEIDGDYAEVTVVFDDGEEETFDLVKINGNWKVDIDMDFNYK